MTGIPPVFCLLKAFSGGKVQKAMILYSRHEGGKVRLNAHPAPLTDASGQYSLVLEEAAQAATPTPFEATLVSAGTESTTRFWFTPFQAYFRPSKAWIPILDLEAPPRLPALHVFALEGDTPATCADRIRSLELLRARVLNERLPHPPEVARDPLYYHPSAFDDSPDLLSFTDEMPVAVPATTAAPPQRQPSPSPPGFVPRFVADLVKREAIAKGDSCAITMAAITECAKPVMTNCFHIFEAEALEVWLRTHDACPSCRQAVSDVMEI